MGHSVIRSNIRSGETRDCATGGLLSLLIWRQTGSFSLVAADLALVVANEAP